MLLATIDGTQVQPLPFTGEVTSQRCVSAREQVQGRGVHCPNVGGVAIDVAVAKAFLEAVTPAAIEATIEAMRLLQARQDAALSQWRLEIERARYEAERAGRRYRAVDPKNRLVARDLEAEQESRLRELSAAEQ